MTRAGPRALHLYLPNGSRQLRGIFPADRHLTECPRKDCSWPHYKEATFSFCKISPRIHTLPTNFSFWRYNNSVTMASTQGGHIITANDLGSGAVLAIVILMVVAALSTILKVSTKWLKTRSLHADDYLLLTSLVSEPIDNIACVSK